MRKNPEDMLNELYEIDTKNNYRFNFWGGKTWEVENRKTHEGLYTDEGFPAVKKWLKNDIKKNER